MCNIILTRPFANWQQAWFLIVIRLCIFHKLCNVRLNHSVVEITIRNKRVVTTNIQSGGYGTIHNNVLLMTTGVAITSTLCLLQQYS